MIELEFSILWSLLTLGGKECKLIDSKTIVNGFPDNFSKDANDQIRILVELEYLKLGVPSNEMIQENPTICLVRINPEKYEEIKKIVHPEGAHNKDKFTGFSLREELKRKLDKYKTQRLEWNV